MAMVATTRSPGAAMESTRPRGSRTAGPDGVTLLLFTLAGFLAVLALVAWQFRSNGAVHAAPQVVLRRTYVTRVVETVPRSVRAGSSVTQSVSGATAGSSAAAPVTRAS
jgi:hypothetical protein